MIDQIRCDDIFRGHGPLLQTQSLVGAGHAREQNMPGNKKPRHHALRRGRFSLSGGIYLVTTTTDQRVPLFEDFWAGVTVSSCTEDTQLLVDAHMLA